MLTQHYKKLVLLVSIASSTLLLYQNCEYQPRPDAKTTTQQKKISLISSLQTAEEILLVQYPDEHIYTSTENTAQVSTTGNTAATAPNIILPLDTTVTISWNAQSKLLHVVSYKNTQVVSQKECATPPDILAELQSLWSQAKVCKTEFILSPDYVACMAMPIPYAQLQFGSQQLALQKSICAVEEVGLCDLRDQEKLEGIIDELFARQRQLDCQI